MMQCDDETWKLKESSRISHDMKPPALSHKKNTRFHKNDPPCTDLELVIYICNVLFLNFANVVK